MRQRGQEVWHRTSNSEVSASAPVLDADRGLVYFAANEVMALDAASGDSAWVTSFYGTNAGSSPAFDDDRVYVAGADGNVYALPDRGDTIRTTPAWTHTSRKMIVRDLALAGTRLVRVAKDGTLRLLDTTTGERLDRTTLPAETHSSPVLADGQLIVGTRDGRLLTVE